MLYEFCYLRVFIEINQLGWWGEIVAVDAVCKNPSLHFATTVIDSWVTALALDIWRVKTNGMTLLCLVARVIRVHKIPYAVGRTPTVLHSLIELRSNANDQLALIMWHFSSLLFNFLVSLFRELHSVFCVPEENEREKKSIRHYAWNT